MLKRAFPRPWICSRCLRVARRSPKRRSYGTAAAVGSVGRNGGYDLPPFASNPAEIKKDDAVLRQVFDDSALWKEFSKTSLRSARVGLFNNAYLTNPEGFEIWAHKTLRDCQKILSQVLEARSAEQLRALVKKLDRLSDLVCRVIDLSDFVRATHPDQRIQAAATAAHARMFEYMNVLNTTPGICDALEKALSTPEVFKAWDKEELTVARILMQDFKKSAIYLPQQSRDRFVQLSSEISEVGSAFVDNIAPEEYYLKVDASRLAGVDQRVVEQHSRWGSVWLPTTGPAASKILRCAHDPDLRRELYIAHRRASKDSIASLETLLRARAELAQLAGYESYAHNALSDKMAKTPEAANKFLEALHMQNRHLVQADLAHLRDLKKLDPLARKHPLQIDAWDREYYLAQATSQLVSTSNSADLFSFFSLGTVMQGLSRIFHRVYGVRMVPKPTPPGETWNRDVRRLDIVSDEEGHIAVMYCDLFARPGKSPNPAHFTLRCSRAIDSSEIEEASSSLGPFTNPLDAAVDGMSTNRRRSGDLYQLPTIALICDFSHPRSVDTGSSTSTSAPPPALLSFRQVQTLFHEMGHALHSILGRTRLQNVAGTRCATDFAELPSVLMEYFASDPQVLELFARHWQTDEPLPYGLLERRLGVDMRLKATETEAQILLAMLDQAYHSSAPLRPDFDSTAVYHDVFSRGSSVREPPETAWQGYFGHSYGYGASYYSYLFDRTIAGKVWDGVFGSGEKSLDRAAGEKFKGEVLKWGGSRSGWECLAGALDRADLAEGGEEAMRTVGEWGEVFDGERRRFLRSCQDRGLASRLRLAGPTGSLSSSAAPPTLPRSDAAGPISYRRRGSAVAHP